MPEEQTTPVIEPTEPTAPSEPAEPPEGGQSDPWADPEAARKEIERLRKESAGYRTKAKELEPLAKRAKELEDAQKSEAQRLGEQLTAAQERAAKATRTAVAAKVEALAAKDFADPEDAAGALDLAAFVDEDGSIDTAAIKTELSALLKRKPHWAKAPEGPRRPAPDRSQGSSGNQNRPSDPAQEFAGILQNALRRS